MFHSNYVGLSIWYNFRHDDLVVQYWSKVAIFHNPPINYRRQ